MEKICNESKVKTNNTCNTINKWFTNEICWKKRGNLIYCMLFMFWFCCSVFLNLMILDLHILVFRFIAFLTPLVVWDSLLVERLSIWYLLGGQGYMSSANKPKLVTSTLVRYHLKFHFLMTFVCCTLILQFTV